MLKLVLARIGLASDKQRLLSDNPSRPLIVQARQASDEKMGNENSVFALWYMFYVL